MISRRSVNGILLLDKPTGLSSNAALQKVKYLYKAKKAGHSGSLDPLASGLLPICLGEATKFSRFLLDADKHYQVRAKLGIRTDTSDSEGQILQERPVPLLSLDKIESVLNGFRGHITQIPSMFSALKHQGQPLYKLARQGIEVERAPRPLSIYSLTLLDKKEDELQLEVHASKGTYIRTLVEDIGEALGCGAYVTELRRLGSGPYTADQMVSLKALEALAEQSTFEALDQYLQPVTSSVSHMTELVLSDAAAYYLRQGQAIMVPYAPTSGWVRLMSSHQTFIGVGEILDNGKVAPRRLTEEVVSF